MRRTLSVFFHAALFFLLAAICVMPKLSLAQEAQDPTLDFLGMLFKSIGEMKGMSTLMIVGVVIQLLIKLVNLPILGNLFSKLNGAGKLTIILVLNLVGGVIGLMTQNGLSFGAALVHSATLAAFSVLFHQIYKEYIEKKTQA